MQTLTLNDPNFPPTLVDGSLLSDALNFLGNLDILQKPMISVVGARELKPWVLEWVENELGPALVETQTGVVSGGARGADQAAHSLALRKGLPTVVVLPSGLNKIYPKSLKRWHNQPGLLFVSQYDHEQEMRKHHFYHRNRIVVALSPLTLVLQAKEKSGTMMSARAALELGRSVATLPGAALDPCFAGNNQLLFEGADMVRNKTDLVTLIQREQRRLVPVLPEQPNTHGKQHESG